MTSGAILILMGVLFLGFGYMGVPVSFALMAGVFVATAFTPVSLQSMVGQLFHGIDSETLLAVPFFLLVGELMASSDVVHRMIRLSQTLVGHLRGGLAQVVTLFSMFFAGISGSSVADVAVLSRTVAPAMDKEGYDRVFTARSCAHVTSSNCRATSCTLACSIRCRLPRSQAPRPSAGWSHTCAAPTSSPITSPRSPAPTAR